MSKTKFPPDLVASLNENPNVRHATESSIQFSEQFKAAAVDAYLSGKSRRRIFEEAGFDVDALGAKRIHNALGNWLTKRKNGKHVESERRGRQPTKGLTPGERIARLEAKVALLRQENDFLRQIRRLERRHQPSKSPSEKDSS